MAIMHWIWPPGRCQNCQSIYSSSLIDDIPNIKHIHRSDDGRFVLNEDAVDGVLVESKRNSIGSQYSSSDDGGFLPKRSRISCPTWRKPLVNWPSELSFRSDGQPNRWFGLGRNLLQTIPQLHRAPTSTHNSVPVTENLHINTISAHVPTNNLYTPSRLSRIHASSPATSSPLVNSPWSPLYFSDLSSVHPSSAERSYPNQQGNIFSPNNNRSFKNNKNPRYVNELPTLRALHEETRRMTQGFIPVQIPSPPVRSYYANIGPQFYQPQSNKHHHPITSYRPGRSRTYSRYNRMIRAPPELASPLLNLNLNILEQSPESQSSSSGFGSKNTSSHQNQSSQSGTTAHDWRLPPYRSPPKPAMSLQHPSQLNSYHDSLVNSPSSPQSMSHLFELMQRLNLASGTDFKAVDVGSVDGHYEFDPSSPTPTASTPTGRDDFLIQHANELFGSLRNKRLTLHHQPRYDQSIIDARVQAMKEEFYAYRKRQAIKRAGIVLESAC